MWRRLYLGWAGAATYLVMINVTLAHVQAVSDQIPFDMRLLGYTLQDAAQLLTALGEDGRNYYLMRQIPLDTAYPALLAMTLISTFYWLGLRLPYRRLVQVGVVLSLGAAFFDYAENLGIAAMILTWSNLPQTVVYASSFASVAKSLLTTGAVLLVVFLGVLRVLQSKKTLIGD
ncbi:MAG: hypothetical protein ACU0CA_06180 [Paracoccaceae bacterium]